MPDTVNQPVADPDYERAALRIENATLFALVVEARDWLKIVHFRSEVISKFDAAIKQYRKTHPKT